MGRTKELLFNTIIIGIGKFSTKIISFLLLPLYTSILSTEEYGVYDLIVTISTIVLPLITLLMEESMFRFLIDCNNDKERKKVITNTTIFIIIGSLIFSLIYLIISLFINFNYKIAIYLYVLVNISIALRNALTRGLGKIKLYSLSNFITSFLVIVMNILGIVYLKLGVVALLYSNIIAGIVTTIILLIKLELHKNISFKEIDLHLIKEMVRYSIPLVPNSLSWTIINFSDRIILSSYLGLASNGVYSVAHKFPTIIDTVYNFFYTSWKEATAKALKDDDSEEFYNYIYVYLKKFMIAIIFIMIAMLPFVFNIFVKNEFIKAYNYVPILLISIYFGNISGFYGGIFSAYKNTKVMGITTLISAVINIIVNLLLINYFGIWAAAISTLISNIFVYIYRKYKIKEYVLLKDDINKLFVLLMLGIILVSYYTSIVLIHILVLLLVILYSYLLNKKLMQRIFNVIKNKVHK